MTDQADDATREDPDAAEVLSSAWVEQLVDAARQASVPPDAGDVVVAFEVAGGPSWWVGARGGTAVAGAGAAEEADVVLVHDADVAAGIHRGEIDVQRAIADGRLRVRGDVRRLQATRPVLAAVAEATARLRSV